MCLALREGDPAKDSEAFAARLAAAPNAGIKARLPGDQVKAAKPPLRAPADPVVARRQLERAGLPADRRKPGRARRRDTTRALAGQALNGRQ